MKEPEQLILNVLNEFLIYIRRLKTCSTMEEAEAAVEKYLKVIDDLAKEEFEPDTPHYRAQQDFIRAAYNFRKNREIEEKNKH